MAKGRHASDNKAPFIRDLAIMALVIVVVAMVVFGAISFLVNVFGDDTPLASGSSSTTTTTELPATSSTTTTRPTTTSTTRASTTTTSTTAATVTTIRDNAEVRVLVLNSTGISGLAGRLSEALAELGYDMATPDNYPEALEQSRIWYAEGYGAEALELGAQIPDALTEKLEDAELDADIVVVLGASYEE